MTLRARVALAATLAVLVAVLGVSALVYVSIGNQLRQQVDVTLREQGDRVAASPIPTPNPRVGEFPAPPSDTNDLSIFTDSYRQLLDTDGEVRAWTGLASLPVTPVASAIASGDAPPSFENLTIDGEPVRVYTVATDEGAFRFGRSLREVERSLDRLAVALVAIGVGGVATAATLGWLTAATAIRPVHRLSEAARTIKRTGDLSHRLPLQGRDEVASLAGSFNEVLDDLETSQALQRQLVADASHELRTPLTTLRTNIEVLARGHDLPDDERDRIHSDLYAQLTDLTELVGDLIDLARDEQAETPMEPVRLDDLVQEVAARARRQRPTITFEVHANPTTVIGVPERIDRAVSNLVDNAAKWSPTGATVTIAVESGAVTVTDQGPGIDPGDLPHVFDRFYRSPAARQMPGSGLGLAIVRQIAAAHDGTVEVTSVPGAGASFTLRLPEAHRKS